ncbi:MAG TPA: hypothetical protein VF545_02250 [Thermoleophilaceae bacterium]
MSWLRSRRRGELLLAGAILLVFAAAAVNVPQDVRESRWRHRDREAFKAWARDNGGIRSYGVPFPEAHARYDVICAPHFPGGRRHGADYRIHLLIDSHGEGTPRVVRAERRQLKVKPTDTGPKCGAPPAAP